MIEHLNRVSLLGYLNNHTWVLILGLLILGINLGLTLIHSLQERQGKLWRYFGAIAGQRIPDGFGKGIFFVGLTALLWFLGFAGITGICPGCESTRFPMAAIGAIVGGRLSDRLYSHVRLDRADYTDPDHFPVNPGLASTPYYLAEAVMLTVLFLPGLWSDDWAALVAVLGFAVGWGFFWSVLPGLKRIHRVPIVRRLTGSWKRDESWPVGGPLPAWVLHEYDWPRRPAGQAQRIDAGTGGE